jgi:3-methyladenine DNA glycosylase/8-oxoguanine DNA glycosylase
MAIDYKKEVARQAAHLAKSDPALARVIKKVAELEHAWDFAGWAARRENHFKSLVVAIINQQLSGKAADTIQGRFEALFAGDPAVAGAGGLRGGVSPNASDLQLGGDRKKGGRVAVLPAPAAGAVRPTRTRPTRTAKSWRKKFPTPEEVLKMPTAKLRKVGLSAMKVSFIRDLATKIIDGTVDFRKMRKWTDEEVIEHLTRVKGIGRWTAEMFLMFSLGRDDVFSYGDLGLRNAMQKLYKLRKHPSPARAAKISENWKPYRTLASRYLWKSLEIE